MFVVWMHRDGKVVALDGYEDRDLADAYASFMNRRSTAWFEVRSEDGGERA